MHAPGNNAPASMVALAGHPYNILYVGAGIPGMRKVVRVPHGSSVSRTIPGRSSFSFQFNQHLADSDEGEPIRLGKRSLEAIIEGVAAKLREGPPPKHVNDGSTTSSTGNGE